MPEIQDLSLDHFLPLLGQGFSLRLENGETYTLELEEAVSLGSAAGPGFRQPFALHLRHPRGDAFLPQRTYCLEHPTLGAFDLFIVPLGPDARGMRYEIIFS